MFKRFQTQFQPLLTIIEAGFIGLSFVQALRLMIGDLYAHVQSASLVQSYMARGIDFDVTAPDMVTHLHINDIK